MVEILNKVVRVSSLSEYSIKYLKDMRQQATCLFQQQQKNTERGNNNYKDHEMGSFLLCSKSKEVRIAVVD